MKHRTLYIIAALLAVLTSCGGKKSSSSDEQRPLLTVSVEPLRFFAEAVGGDKFRVTSLVPEGSSPETYDPTPQQLIALGKSRAFLRVGYIGYELVWADKLRQNAPGVEFFDMSEGIDLIREEEHDDHSHEGHTHAAGVEPHIWASVQNARVIANNVYRSLCAISPADKEYFRHRLDSLEQEINKVDEAVKAYLSDGQSTFLIYHPALSYFARDYRLQQVSIEKGGKEPSPAYLRQLIELCRDKGVKVVFIQKEFDVRNAEVIAKELGVQVVTIHPLSSRWADEMLRIARALSGGNRSNS